jgi:hypothetical protein
MTLMLPCATVACRFKLRETVNSPEIGDGVVTGAFYEFGKSVSTLPYDDIYYANDVASIDVSHQHGRSSSLCPQRQALQAMKHCDLNSSTLRATSDPQKEVNIKCGSA